MVVQYTRTESDRLRYAPTRLAGSPMARDLENKRITRVMPLERVGKVGGSSRSDTDEPDPSAIVSDCERQKKNKNQTHDLE